MKTMQQIREERAAGKFEGNAPMQSTKASVVEKLFRMEDSVKRNLQDYAKLRQALREQRIADKYNW